MVGCRLSSLRPAAAAAAEAAAVRSYRHSCTTATRGTAALPAPCIPNCLTHTCTPAHACSLCPPPYDARGGTVYGRRVPGFPYGASSLMPELSTRRCARGHARPHRAQVASRREGRELRMLRDKLRQRFTVRSDTSDTTCHRCQPVCPGWPARMDGGGGGGGVPGRALLGRTGHIHTTPLHTHVR